MHECCYYDCFESDAHHTAAHACSIPVLGRWCTALPRQLNLCAHSRVPRTPKAMSSKAHNFLNLKAWHPNNARNRRKIAEAEQAVSALALQKLPLALAPFICHIRNASTHSTTPQHAQKVKSEIDAKARLEAQYEAIKQRRLLAEATGEQDQLAGTDEGTAWMYAGHGVGDGG